MAPKKKTPAKRTRRAVRGRRTLGEREQAAAKLHDEWWAKMRFALNKVEHYRSELDAVRSAQAKAAADKVFGD